jgi:GntR family transcriptional regulator
MTWEVARQLILGDISRLGHGAELNSDAEYARRADVSVPTIKRAMADLARRGLVVRQRGRRTTASQEGAIVSGADFSFSRSANSRGQQVVTELLEKSCRAPHREPGAEFEIQAHRTLGLKRGQPFVAIARLRILDGSSRVIQRSYLNPRHYSARFLTSHDFENESLLEIIEGYGLKLHSRDTKIRAALSNDSEAALLDLEPGEPVLRVDQQFYATALDSERIFTAEYLHATYARWEYVITDRR